MSYGKIYTSDFKSLDGISYTLEIYKKDYSGSITAIVAAAVPVVHRWEGTEPKDPIRGSVLEAKIINENNNLPLSSFYSEDDNTFLIKFLTGANVLFTGFLVQDDCTEILVDHTHEIVLSATDNLGLLKEIKLNEAAALYGPSTITTENLKSYGSSYEIYVTDYTTTAVAGDTVIITGTGAIDGTYNVRYTFFSADGIGLVMYQYVPSAYLGSATVNVIHPVDLSVRITLLEVVRMCIKSVGFDLNTIVYGKLIHNTLTYATTNFLNKTYIDPETFKIGDGYKNCYEILESIFSRFKATLLQAYGVWNIVRFDELRQYSGAIPGMEYDEDFAFVQNVTLSNLFEAGRFEDGFDTYNETELQTSILRPLRYVKETFNYNIPKDILRNADLSRLGNLITSYASGSNTVREYEFPDWEPGFRYTTGGGGVFYSGSNAFIRVTTDSVGTETERIVVINGGTSSHPYALMGFPIEVNAKDKFKFSLSFKTSNSQPGNVLTVFHILLVTQLPLAPIGANNRYVYSSAYEWDTRSGFSYNTIAGSNTNQWQSMSMESKPIPFDGLLYIMLPQASATGAETHIKDIRLDYSPYVNDTSQIVGHTHTDTQQIETKNKEETDLGLDDTPRNAVAGTLFLETFTGAIQNRTTKWQRGTTVESKRIGEITTFDELFYRRIQRVKLEGIFYGLLQTLTLSPLSRFTYDLYPDLNFLAGDCEIDYRNDSARLLLQEAYKDTENDTNLDEIYEFKYLFDKK